MKTLAVAILYIIVVSSCFSCRSDHGSQEHLLSKFRKNNQALMGIVSYIEEKYINTNDRAELPRKTFLWCPKVGFDNSDYRICDNYLAEEMEALGISLVSIEKNICFADRNFDLVRFEISETVPGGGRPYYYYSFCNSYNSKVVTKNIVNIPLKENWSLFIEKD